jgi:hypothetical protein
VAASAANCKPEVPVPDGGKAWMGLGARAIELEELAL